MKKAMLLAAAVTTVFVTTACGAPQGYTSSSGSHWEYDIKLKDGRILHCVTIDNAVGSSGSSCDWENAK